MKRSAPARSSEVDLELLLFQKKGCILSSFEMALIEDMIVNVGEFHG